MLQILHNPHCSKSRCALDYLKEHDIEFNLRDYQKEPLDKEELRTLCKELKLEPEAIVRKNEQLYKDNFSQHPYTNDEWLEILAKHPQLIQRPIVIKNGKAIIARPMEKLDEFLSN